MTLVVFLLLALAGCGGGSSPPASPPPNPIFVTTGGRDTNSGELDAPLRSIKKAAQLALDGYEIIVAPGTYTEEISTDRTGTPAQAVTFTADVSGELTMGQPG